MTDLAEPDLQLRLDGLRGELLRAREYLLDSAGPPGAGQLDDDIGESDASTVVEQRAEAALVRLRQHRTIAQINAALERMENGSYGLCTDCNTPIPVERLEAMLTASRCLGCQYQEEVSRPR
jgi:DnaK suppressor protein